MPAPDLHVHSWYSTYDGAGSPQAVVDRAVEMGWRAVTLTEHGHMMSAPALYVAAKKAGIKPIIGCEMYVTAEEDLIDGDDSVLKSRRHLTVLALSFEGYKNIVAWLTHAQSRPLYYKAARISLERMAEIAPHPLHHNVILSGCLGGELCQCILHSDDDGLAALYLESAASMFPNFYVELQNHAIDKYLGMGNTNYDTVVANQYVVNDRLLGLATKLGLPVIVTNDSHYQTQQQRKSHIAMMSRKQSKRDKEAHEGATTDGSAADFVMQYQYWGQYMRPMEQIAATLPTWAERESIASIEEIVDAADVRLDPLDKRTYTFPRSQAPDPIKELRLRSKPRLKLMAQRHGQVALDRFDYELAAMKDFAHYLLIYSDIVQIARDQGSYTWTRGSACGSLVNFCARVHNIDPLHYNLLFERFVNPARSTFPDVDIDIEAHRQEDVAREVTAYMDDLGQEMLRICNYTTTANRQAFRLMAEANGVPKERIDELAKIIPQMIDTGMAGDDEEAYEILRDELGLDIHGQAADVFDAPSGVSQHACAFVIGTKERPLSDWVPTYRIGSSDSLVTAYNMKWIEALGYLKLDLLKLDTLTIMHDIARQLGHGIDWLDTLCQSEVGIYDEEDPLTFKMLCAGKTDGVFTFQGGTQRRGCLEVQPQNTQDLVVVNALYRPSGTRTGLSDELVKRRNGTEQWAPINEFTANRWGDTYDLPIFQEQVMEMGFDLGMDGAEVDDLYKAIKTAKGMGRGAAELFTAFEPTFRKHVEDKMPTSEANEIWARWDAMQGYTFNKIHATSFAILGKKSAKLKAHHPQEHYIATLNRYPDNPRYVAAAISESFAFEPPSVNAGSVGFARGVGNQSIQLGLLRVSGIGAGAASEIVRNQPFSSVEDLRARTNTTRLKNPGIEALAAVGALEDLGVGGFADDVDQLKLLKFVLGTPTAFEGKDPQLFSRRGGQWKYLGLDASATFTEGKTFCAKMFWLPPDTELALKTSGTGRWNAYLLTVVDINGIPFDLQVAESKYEESEMLKKLAEIPNLVFCAEGQIVMPFLRGGNTCFRLWGVAGAEQSTPQMWNCTEDDARRIIQLAIAKKNSRRSR